MWLPHSPGLDLSVLPVDGARRIGDEVELSCKEGYGQAFTISIKNNLGPAEVRVDSDGGDAAIVVESVIALVAEKLKNSKNWKLKNSN